VGTLVAPLEASASNDPSASPAAGGGGSTTASGLASSTATALPWKKVGLALTVLIGLGVGLLWWRRRAADAADAAPSPATTDQVEEAPVAPRAHVRPAAVRTSSVVVSAPRTAAPGPDAPTPAPVDIAPIDVAPASAVPAPVEVAAQAQVDPVGDASTSTPEPAPEVAVPPAAKPAAPQLSGNVRVITPPGRPPGS